jgi:replicative DNA helicase
MIRQEIRSTSEKGSGLARKLEVPVVDHVEK